MMNKRGSTEQSMILNMIDMIIRALFVIFAFVIIINVVRIALLETGYDMARGSFQRFTDTVRLMDQDEPKIVHVQMENGAWIFGFNKGTTYTTYWDYNFLGSEEKYEISKPKACPVDKACLCLCTADCKKTIEKCKTFDGVSSFIVEGVENTYNVGRENLILKGGVALEKLTGFELSKGEGKKLYIRKPGGARKICCKPTILFSVTFELSPSPFIIASNAQFEKPEEDHTYKYTLSSSLIISVDNVKYAVETINKEGVVIRKEGEGYDAVWLFIRKDGIQGYLSLEDGKKIDKLKEEQSTINVNCTCREVCGSGEFEDTEGTCP